MLGFKLGWLIAISDKSSFHGAASGRRSCFPAPHVSGGAPRPLHSPRVSRGQRFNSEDEKQSRNLNFVP